MFQSLCYGFEGAVRPTTSTFIYSASRPSGFVDYFQISEAMSSIVFQYSYSHLMYLSYFFTNVYFNSS